MAVNQALREPRGSLRNCPSQTPGGVLMSGPLELSGVLLLCGKSEAVLGRLCPYTNPCCWLDSTITLTVVSARDCKCVCPQAGNTFSCFTFFTPSGYVQNGILYSTCFCSVQHEYFARGAHFHFAFSKMCSIHQCKLFVSQNAMCSA